MTPLDQLAQASRVWLTIGPDGALPGISYTDAARLAAKGLLELDGRTPLGVRLTGKGWAQALR